MINHERERNLTQRAQLRLDCLRLATELLDLQRMPQAVTLNSDKLPELTPELIHLTRRIYAEVRNGSHEPE